MILPTEPVRYESEMLPLFRPSLTSVLGLRDADRLTVIEEAILGSTIPDLLIGIWRTDPTKLVRTNSTVVEASILALLEQVIEIEASEVGALLYLQDQSAARAIDRLEKRGLLLRPTPTRLRIASAAESRHLEIVAVEAKMSRWTRALEQAEDYLRFADRSYVLLDGNQLCPTEEMITECSRRRVGLVLLHRFVVRLLQPAVPQKVTPCRDRITAADKLYRVGSC